MRLSVHCTVKGDRRLDDKILAQLSRAVRKAAFDVQGMAAAAAPVDTGALRNSIHVVTDRQDQYEGAKRAALAARPKARFFDPVRPKRRLEAIVAVGVEYGFWVEHGRHGTPGRPYLTPAVEHVRPAFEAAVRRALTGSLI